MTMTRWGLPYSDTKPTPLLFISWHLPVQMNATKRVIASSAAIDGTGDRAVNRKHLTLSY
jgi:hypothetical protein